MGKSGSGGKKAGKVKAEPHEQVSARVPLNTRVPAALYEKLTTHVYGRRAKQEKVSIQDVVEAAVAAYLDAYADAKKRGA